MQGVFVIGSLCQCCCDCLFRHVLLLVYGLLFNMLLNVCLRKVLCWFGGWFVNVVLIVCLSMACAGLFFGCVAYGFAVQCVCDWLFRQCELCCFLRICRCYCVSLLRKVFVMCWLVFKVVVIVCLSKVSCQCWVGFPTLLRLFVHVRVCVSFRLDVKVLVIGCSNTNFNNLWVVVSRLLCLPM